MAVDSSSRPIPDSRKGRSAGSKEERRLEIDAELSLPAAHVMVARLYHDAPDRNFFRRDRVYWVDLCLTPRRPNASARYCNHWSPSRFAQMGSLIAFPPRERLELTSAGGRHASLICQLQADAVERWLSPDFTWTERRLEATLNIASDAIRTLMLRLNFEMRNPGIGSSALCQSIIDQLSIELARYLSAASDADEKGGLASWRLRIVDERIADPELAYPGVAELAALCRLSTRQFSRAFKASRGCSISDYLAQTRIDAAKRKLFGRDALSSISNALGFSSQSSFTAAFRRATGTTPDQFRKQIKASRKV